MRVLRFLSLFFLCIASLDANEAITTKLNALLSFKPSYAPISLNYDPFITQAEEDNASEHVGDLSAPKMKQPLKLISVMNKRAFIGGAWYGIGDTLEAEGTITAIEPTSVTITQGKEKKKMFFDTSKELLHVKESKQ